MLERITQPSSINQQNEESNERSHHRDNRGNYYNTWNWGNKLQPVPSSFEFPICNISHLWNFWNFGNLAENIRPYRTFHDFNMPGKKSKQLLIRARKVMEKIIDTGINNQTREDIRKFTFQESKLFFVNAYSK